MSNTNIAPVAESTKYTLIWGFLMNSGFERREEFQGVAGRAACWERTQAVMSLRGCPRNDGKPHPVCLLHVYTTDGLYFVKDHPALATTVCDMLRLARQVEERRLALVEAEAMYEREQAFAARCQTLTGAK